MAFKDSTWRGMFATGHFKLLVRFVVFSLLDLAAGNHENGYTLHFSGHISGHFNGILANWLNESAIINGFYKGSFTGLFAHTLPLDGSNPMVGLIFGRYDNLLPEGQEEDIAGLFNGTLNGDITQENESEEIVCDCKQGLVIGGFVLTGLFILAVVLSVTICCCVKKNNRQMAIVSQESRQTAHQPMSQPANQPPNHQTRQPASQTARQRSHQPASTNANRPTAQPLTTTNNQPLAPPSLYQEPMAGYPVYPPSQPAGYTQPRQDLTSDSFTQDDQPPSYSSVMASGQGKRSLPPMTRQPSIIHMPGAQPTAPLPQIQPSAPLRGH